MSTQTPDPQAIDALLRRIATSTPAAPAPRPSTPGDPAQGALAARIAAQVQAAQARERGAARRQRVGRSSPLGTWAAAASLLLAVAVGGLGQQPRQLPDYSIEIAGSDQSTRSTGSAPAPSEVLKFSPGNRLRITARPAQRAAGPLSAALWRHSPAGPILVTLPINVSTSGAVQLDAPVDGSLLQGPGTHRLWLVLSASPGSSLKPASLPSIDTAGHYGPSYVLPIDLELQSQ